MPGPLLVSGSGSLLVSGEGPPGLLVKIDEDGTRTVGRFIKRAFTPVNGH